MNITRQLAIRAEPQVIELAVPHPEGGMDPEVPQFLTPFRITGVLRIGHTWDLADPDAPILVRDTDISGAPASGKLFVEGRCPACIAKSAIYRSATETMIVLEHRKGCRWFTDLMAEARP